jgi:hypothetical protein
MTNEQSPCFLPPFFSSLQALYHERSAVGKAVVLMTAMKSYWLKKCEKPPHPPPTLVKPTVNVCDSGVWMKKKSVVNSSRSVLPATDICCCFCVVRLRLCRRTRCKWPILCHSLSWLLLTSILGISGKEKRETRNIIYNLHIPTVYKFYHLHLW